MPVLKERKLKPAKNKLRQASNQTEDFKFKKFRAELRTNRRILNSTVCMHSRRQELVTNCSLITTQTLEDGEIVTDIDETLRTITSKDNNDDNNEVVDDNDDCIVVEKPIEQIIIDDDTSPIIEEEDRKNVIFFEDVTGTPSLKFTPKQIEEKMTPPSKRRRSCTIVSNNSDDVIVLDETHNSLDDSILFVSESAPDFIPLTSENVPKPIKFVRNPLSSKHKLQQSSNETLFSKSEKKSLEAYNFNTYNPRLAEDKAIEKEKLKRMVIIDGCNVAFAHTRGREFSVKGLQICIEYFKKMGHEVKAVVPQMRLQYRFSSDARALDKLYKEGFVVLTPSKNIPGNTSSSYDDRLILQLASQMDAAIVSNDNYRDLIDENAAFKKLILNRVIGYTWVNDVFMIPKDPYGKKGPTLQEILNRNSKRSHNMPQS